MSRKATIAALVIGAALRLTWGGDIEFKYDEHWLYERATLAGHEPFPWLGMPSSLNVLNPGLSVWVFMMLAKITDAATPIALARGVQLLNILALAAVAVFAWTSVDAREREPWLWGVSLAAVNPMAVVLARKIWQQSVLPIFGVGVIVGWRYRDRQWGAFAWGLIGVCMGQVHISGFFLTAGFALWAIVFDRARTRWLWWAAGIAAGTAPMVPWLAHLFSSFATRPRDSFELVRLLLPIYWLHWIVEPWGIGLWQSLGGHFGSFLEGGPVGLVGVLHALALLLGVLLLSIAVIRCRRDETKWSGLLIGDTATAFTTQAALLGCGVLMTASTLEVHHSYLNAVFPLEFVWLSYMVLGADTGQSSRRFARRALAALWVVELLISISFLRYIHVNGGAPGADYGVAFSAQPPGATFSR